MAKRTTEEILAQREAWLARKTARESGEDIPVVPPTRPDEDPAVFPTPETLKAASEPETAEAAPEAAASDVEEAVPPKPEPEATPPAPQPEEADQPEETAQPTDGALKPEAPKTKRSQEERAAAREAFLAARAAKAAGGQAASEAAPAPAAEKPAPAPAKPAAEAPAPRPKPAPKPKPKRSPKPSQAKKEEPEPAGPLTRREFLNYAWLASIALFSLETVGIALWFAFPNFREGEFGGLFPIGAATEVLPEVNAPPIPFTDGKFWLVNLDIEGPDGELNKGIQAIYKVCTHLGCLYDWADVTSRFECPCHGSKFALTGDYLEGPAPRNLDRFVIQAVAPDGSIKENTEGEPLEINGDEELVIDTGRRILGETHA